MSGAGPAILVVSCLALLGILSFFLFSYFAHCFLIVVIDSASGINEIRWPSESITDWLTQPIYLLWVLLPLLFVPSMVLVATGDAVTFLLTMLVLLWLVSPIMFLSSLAAKSWMSLLYGPFLKRWARYFFAYAMFLIWSGALTAVGAALLVWSVTSMLGVAMAALFLPALFLLYFRVLGRYAWYVTTRRMKKAKKKPINPTKGLKVESLDPWAPPDGVAPEGERTEVLRAPGTLDDDDTSLDSTELPQVREQLRDKIQPAHKRSSTDKLTALPPHAKTAPLAPADESEEDTPPEPEQEEDEEDEWTTGKKPYLVMTEAKARSSYVERKDDPGSEADGYSVEQISLSAPVSLWQYYAERERKEEELRAQGKSVRQYERPRKPPTLWQAMTQEIASFLFFSHSLRCWINLAILLGVELALINTIVQITRMLITAG